MAWDLTVIGRNSEICVADLDGSDEVNLTANAAFDAAAFYWELPPLTRETIVRDAEFVLIEAPMLARIPPERAPFASYFDRAQHEDVIVFPNLGGDAILIVPCPRGPDEHYPHLAAFLRGADTQQVRALWQKTAQEMLAEHGRRRGGLAAYPHRQPAEILQSCSLP